MREDGLLATPESRWRKTERPVGVRHDRGAPRTGATMNAPDTTDWIAISLCRLMRNVNVG
jgi:hypothetical protein